MRDLPDDFQLEHLNAALAFIPVSRRTLALDIGAHRGIWTKRMSEVFEHVYAFEPNAVMFDQIPIPQNVTTYNLACGSQISRCSLKAGKKNTGQTYCVDGNDLEIVTIDYIMPHNVGFIKIDVEGMEFDVLKGAQKTIEKYKPFIMIEENRLCERYGHKPERASRLLRKWGAKKLMTLHMQPEKDINVLFGWDV